GTKERRITRKMLAHAVLREYQKLGRKVGQLRPPMLAGVDLESGEQLTEEVRVCHIHRDGMVGRAVWYNVMFWTGDLGAFQKSTEGKIQITGTEKLITAKIEALPPRD
ncbi:MAG: hypothetical protein QGI09_01800, partial [Dehalococcoidia bacterium]|nr:hypothetical protein [Dehalococcoidia bacterium]